MPILPQVRAEVWIRLICPDEHKSYVDAEVVLQMVGYVRNA